MSVKSLGRVIALLFTISAVSLARGQTSAPSGSTPSSVDSLLAKLGSDDSAERKQTIIDLGHSQDMRLIPFFEAFTEGSVYQYQGKIVLGLENDVDASGQKVTPIVDPLSRTPILDTAGKPLVIPVKSLKDASASRRERSAVRDAVILLRLSDPDPGNRWTAVVKAGDSGNDALITPLNELLKTEANKRVAYAIRESVALLELSKTASGTDAESKKEHLAAVNELGEDTSARALPRLKELSVKATDPDRKAAYAAAISKIESWQTKAEWISNIFSGLSTGSILVLMALGLSIVFGLMGVINMAHGELMMLGAYATYLTQVAFVKWMPVGVFNWYYIVAIPVSFLVAAIFGYLIEYLVIRHLYGRPLETLLATWGIGLVLIQMVRLEFGDNIAVNAPTWLQGGVEVAQDVTLPWARLFIILFCVACILLVYFIVGKTSMGLLIRATTQNRQMAASLGVKTRAIDGYTFALGAGLAGLAGCALCPIGGVTPDMGQNYIVDSFLVVVTGGVGKLAGAIWAGAGLGMLNKLLEPIFQTVWAKVLILFAVVLFLQWKPSGLFPAKGRLADA